MPVEYEFLNKRYGVYLDSGTTLIHGPPEIIDLIYKDIESKCADPHSGRTCGGHKSIEMSTKCYDFSPSASFPNIEDWYESFPIVTFKFGDNVSLDLHPRDYFFIENDRQCFGFDYLKTKMILGSIFMRNFDVQFDRQNSKIRIARANCSGDDEASLDRHYGKTGEEKLSQVIKM